MKKLSINRDEITLDQAELNAAIQSSLDDTHRDLAWIRTSLIAALYSVLTIVNYVTLDGQARVDAMMFSMVVAVSFALITCFHRLLHYPARQTNLVTFGGICILQLDSIAFSIVTDDLMSGFGVYFMMIGAGIFMTTTRSVVIACVMLLTTWIAAVVLRDVSPDLGREAMMLIAASFGAFFFFFMRVRSTRRLTEHQLMEQKYKESLEDALEHIETLSGLLPICASCKNIRVEGNKWTELSVYVRERSNVEFTHSVCPDCQKELYPQLNPELNPEQKKDLRVD